MNLRQIDIFRAVMGAGSTIGAAAVLKLSQSAVSRQLQQLEAELGFDLFNRSKGRLVARPEALALLGQVEQLSDIVGRVQRFAEELKAGAVGYGLLKVAVPHSLATTLMPGVVRSFLASRPHVAIEILTGPYEGLERLVATRAVDLAFVRLPPETAGFTQRRLLRSDAVCIMPRGHGLAGLPVVRPADLAGQKLVLLGRQSTTWQEVATILRRRGIAVSSQVEAHSVASACALVAEGLGVSVVTKFMAALLIGPALEMRPFDPSLTNDYGVITLADAPPSIVAEQFIEALCAALAVLP